MDIVEELLKAFNDYTENHKKTTKSVGVEHIESAKQDSFLEKKREYIVDIIIKKIGAEKINEALFKKFKDTDKLALKYNIITGKRQKLALLAQQYKSSGVDKLIMEQPTPDKSVSEYDAIENKLTELSKLLPPEAQKTYNDYCILNNSSQIFLLEHIDEIISGLKEVVDEKSNQELTEELKNYVPITERPFKEISTPIFNEDFPELEKKATTPDEKDALAYIKENIRVCSELGNYYSGLQMQVMQQQKGVEEEVSGKFIEKNEKFKDLYVTEHSVNQLAPGKEKEYDEFEKMQYEYSDETKAAMKKIMHTLDEQGYITNENVMIAEESEPKMYGFIGMQYCFHNISEAMKRKDVTALPALVEKYKKTKAMYDELMNISKESFSHVPLLYSGNVDVARNKDMPMEYRADSHNVSMISSLYVSLKLCKLTNTSIDDFVDNPNACVRSAYDKLFDCYNVDKIMQEKSLGDALYFMKERDVDTLCQNANFSGIVARGSECLKAYEKDEEKLIHNTFVCRTNHKMFGENANNYISSIDYLGKDQDGTVLNLAIYGKTKPIAELTRTPSNKYDFFTRKKYGMLDTESYIKNNELDYASIKSNIKELYEDCVKNYVLTGKRMDQSLLKSLKNVTAKIAELKPEEANKEEFKSLKKFTSSLRRYPKAVLLTQIFQKDGKPLTEEKTNVILFAIKKEKDDYSQKGLMTRIVSYLPFVNNSATRARHAYLAAEEMLKEKGVTQKEIDDFKPNEAPCYKPEIECKNFGKITVDVRPESERIDLHTKIKESLTEEIEFEKNNECEKPICLETEEEKQQFFKDNDL